jgi:hypothetical protein
MKSNLPFLLLVSVFVFFFIFDFVVAGGDSSEGFCQRTPSDYEKIEKFRKEFGLPSKVHDDLVAARNEIEARQKMMENQRNFPHKVESQRYVNANHI